MTTPRKPCRNPDHDGCEIHEIRITATADTVPELITKLLGQLAFQCPWTVTELPERVDTPENFFQTLDYFRRQGWMTCLATIGAALEDLGKQNPDHPDV